MAIVVPFLWPLVPFSRNNFHVVTPGSVYRSAQMDEGDLRLAAVRYRIRTVVNLRGPQPAAWYEREKRLAEALAINYVDIPDFDAHRLPPPQGLIDLLKTLRQGPYPLLIHCKAGADRTGLACVLYQVVIERVPLEKACRRQLTWRYGHFPLGKTRAMGEFFALYRRTGNGKPLDRWIREDYPAWYRQEAETGKERRARGEGERSAPRSTKIVRPPASADSAFLLVRQWLVG